MAGDDLFDREGFGQGKGQVLVYHFGSLVYSKLGMNPYKYRRYAVGILSLTVSNFEEWSI